MRLRLGRFAWELYYTRTKAVLPRQEVRRRVALVCGHLGYVTGLLEYVMTDMLWLRGFALTGCVLIVGYQVAQPRILLLSAGWNGAYCIVNAYHIYLLKRKPPDLSGEEAALLEALGGESRIARRDFQTLLEIGEWKRLEDGEALIEEGQDGNARDVSLVASGSCEVRRGDLVLARVGPGGVVGEIAALAIDTKRPVPPSSATVVARTGGATCLCVPLERLQKAPDLREGLQGVFAAALASKVAAMNQESRVLQYAAVLEMACAAGVDPDAAVVAAVASFRRQRGVTDDEHLRTAHSLSRCSGSSLLGLPATS